MSIKRAAPLHFAHAPVFSIPLTETTLDEEEVEAATRVLRSKWLTMGAEVQAFEAEFAAALGAAHAIAVSNATIGLELIYRAAGIGPKDEVLIPSITFIACYNAARLLGARPVLVDAVSEEDWTLSVEDVARKITPRTKAVVSMPHGGYAPDMAGLERLCKERGVVLLEDACHAPLAQLDGRRIGAFGLAAAWSFFGNKNMTTGEGGMITTDDPGFAERCRLMRSHGITKPTWSRAQGHAFSYDVSLVGTNGRMDEIRAAIGRVQLRKLPGATARRRMVADLLRRKLQDAQIDGLVIPFTLARGVPAPHVFCVLLPPRANRDHVMAAMKERGVQTSIHYPPINSFTATAEWFAKNGGAEGLPVTDRIAPRILTLPLSPSMTEEQCAYVAEALRSCLP